MGGWRSSGSLGPDTGAGDAPRDGKIRIAAHDTAHVFHHNPRRHQLEAGIVLAESAAHSSGLGQAVRAPPIRERHPFTVFC